MGGGCWALRAHTSGSFLWYPVVQAVSGPGGQAFRTRCCSSTGAVVADCVAIGVAGCAGFGVPPAAGGAATAAEEFVAAAAFGADCGGAVAASPVLHLM